MRPANIVTAIADVLAGYAIAFSHFREFDIVNWTLILATVGLYGGGVVLNDAFDAKLDAVERPERPIPSGEISVKNAKGLGFLLLVMGCSAAFYNHIISGLIAISIAILAVIYNAYGKNNSFIGPINMGLCRGGNLLLGISANPETISNWGYLAIISIIYIAAITMVSRGEVNGGNSKILYTAGLLYLFVIFAQVYVAYNTAHELFAPLILLFIFGFFIFKPLIKAINDPVGPNIGKAVKAGVIALILMDAAWCMAFGYTTLGLITLCLMPVSVFLSKYFAVT
ncbi:MAG: UbiA-like protein EboC [Bacteroidetes bacterium]|nr:UbiA-like protein EboC [Bacteroidota bacterium]